MSKTGYIANQTFKISKLIDEGKFNLALISINNLIEKYPYDTNLLNQLARINILEKNYKEALSILELLNENIIFLRKTVLYIKLKKEEKLFEMYQKYFYNNKEYQLLYKMDNIYNDLKLYLDKKYKQDLNIDLNHLSYTKQQIYSYSKERALEHIKTEHYNNRDSQKSLFDESIDIDNLFECVNDYIKNNDDGTISKYTTEAFYFYYPDCGTTRGSGNLNCFCVFTLLGSRNILNMYPVKKIKDRELLYLNERPQSKKKIRIKTGLERFNERYQ